MRNIKTLSELEDKYIGEKGTSERTAYEKKVTNFIVRHNYRTSSSSNKYTTLRKMANAAVR